MDPESEIKATISGSFSKFKPEIDTAIDEFSDLGVTVLQPEKGWLYKPPQKIIVPKFRPLRTELGLSIREVEDAFLDSISKSDFVFVVNPEGFIGNSVAFELGYALGQEIPIYSLRPIILDLQNDPTSIEYLHFIKHLSPKEILEDLRQVRTSPQSYSNTS